MAVTTVQSHFRVRTDTTAAQGGTPVWAAALDTNPLPGSVGVGTPFRIRFTISSTGSSTTGTHPWNIFVSRNGGAFAQVTTSTTFVITTDATAGASANNSAITTSLLGGTGTFDGIGEYNDTGTTGNVSIPGGDFSEFEFGLQFTSSVVEGDNYQFEVFLNGVALNTYTVIPKLTIAQVATYGNEPQQQLVQPAWQPDPNPACYDFIGGNGPYLPRRLAPSLLGADLVQQDYRLRTDATAAQGGTPVWADAQNTTNATANYIGEFSVSTAYRFRFSVYTSGSAATNSPFQLYVSRNGGTYQLLTTSGTYIQATDATAGASSNNSVITTSLLTESTGTFDGVGVYNDTGATSSVSIPSLDRAEFEFGFQLTTSNSIGDTFLFQVWYNNAPLTTYTNTPAICVGGNVTNPVNTLTATFPFNTGLRNDFTGYVGSEFTTAASGPPIIATALGCWVNATNTASITINIVDSATGNAIVATTTLNPTGLTPGFNYVPITAVTLTANHTYYLVRSTTSGGDYWWAQSPVPTLNFGATLVGRVSGTGGTSWSFPGGGTYAGVDLISVQNPPVANPYSQQQNAASAWQPDPVYYQFVGGKAPYLPAYLPVSVTAVPVNNPIPALQGKMPWWTWWLPPDPAPQLQPKLAQGPPPSQPARTLDLTAILASWVTPATPAITANNLPPSITAVPVNNPPFNSRDNASGILAAWIPPPPQAPVAGNINAVFEAVPVNNPPFSSRDNASGILDAWIPPPPQPIVAGLVGPALETAPVVNNPPFSHPGRNEAVSRSVAAWQPDPVYYQFAGGSAPYLPRYLPPAITAVPVNNPPFTQRNNLTGIFEAAWEPFPPLPVLGVKLTPPSVDNPPFGAKPALTALAAWDIQVQPVLPGRIAAVSFVVPIPRGVDQVSIAGAWKAQDGLPVVARQLAPPLLVLNQQPPPLGHVDVSGAWIPPDPAVQMPRHLPQAFVPPAVSNPSPGGRNITSQLIWWAAIDPVQLRPFYATIAQPLLFIDPQYFLGGPANARGLSGPSGLSSSRAVIGPVLRTETGPSERTAQGPSGGRVTSD